VLRIQQLRRALLTGLDRGQLSLELLELLLATYRYDHRARTKRAGGPQPNSRGTLASTFAKRTQFCHPSSDSGNAGYVQGNAWEAAGVEFIDEKRRWRRGPPAKAEQEILEVMAAISCGHEQDAVVGESPAAVSFANSASLAAPMSGQIRAPALYEVPDL
jgi:hypothetical protein